MNGEMSSAAMTNAVRTTPVRINAVAGFEQLGEIGITRKSRAAGTSPSP